MIKQDIYFGLRRIPSELVHPRNKYPIAWSMSVNIDSVGEKHLTVHYDTTHFRLFNISLAWPLRDSH